MQSVTLEEARTHLIDLIDAATAGEDIFIRKNDSVSVQLVPQRASRRTRQFGSAKGLIVMAPDFDDPIEDFKEYTE
jgi:antitoxin (DNA-binding transcriptional repressor) of toxin-antitoxin stability system